MKQDSTSKCGDHIRSLDEVCAALVQIFTDNEFVANTGLSFDDWTHVSEWLHLAAGVQSVQIRGLDLSGSAMWCRGATEFEDEQDSLHSKVASELTRFMFIWGALESLVRITGCEKESPSHGRIGALCDYLRSRLPIGYNFEPYDVLLGQLNRLVPRLDDRFSKEQISVPRAPYLSYYGYGIFIVSKIRNSLAHGSLSIPQAYDEQSGHEHLQLIHSSSHISVLTIQMLADSFLRNNDFEIDMISGLNLDDERILVSSLLRTLHKPSLMDV